MKDILGVDYIALPKCVLKLFAEWCSPCKRLFPIVEAAAANTDIPFYSVDIDVVPEIASKYRVKGVPTLLFIRFGQEVDRITGIATKEQIEEKLELL